MTAWDIGGRYSGMLSGGSGEDRLVDHTCAHPTSITARAAGQR